MPVARQPLAAVLTGLALAFSGQPASAAPGDVLFFDNFDGGAGCDTLGPDWTASNSTRAGTSIQTSRSGACSMFTRHNAVSVTSRVIDLSAAQGVDLALWIRQGSDAFSEDVDNNEDLALEYLSSTGNWTTLQTYFGSGANGQILTYDAPLPLNALHAGFRVRLRQLTGSGSDFDYWHIDDVTLTETGPPPDPPPSGLGINQCEYFEDGFGNWTASNTTRAGINGDTASSPSSAAFVRHGNVTVTSDPFDARGLETLEIWVRRGSDTFSEDPDGGENLTLQYLDANGRWVTLESFNGGGTPGQVFDRSYTIPANAGHTGFRVRYNLSAGSGAPFDYWHLDDLCLVGGSPNLDVNKSVSIEQDPVNDTNAPKSIPGAWAHYRITVTNTGAGMVDAGTIEIADAIGAQTTLFTGDLDGNGSPFRFIDGTGADASGLSLNFTGLASTSDGVVFRDASDNSITPGGGFDTAVRAFELTFDGAMNAAIGGATPTFSIEYRVRVD